MLNRAYAADVVVGNACPGCGSTITAGQVVVQCPGPCKRWYHAEHWVELGNHCAIFGCPGSSSVNSEPPPEPPLDDIHVEPLPPLLPPADPELLKQITLGPTLDAAPGRPGSTDSSSEAGQPLPDIQIYNAPPGPLQAVPEVIPESITLNDWEIRMEELLRKTPLGAVMSISRVRRLFGDTINPDKIYVVFAVLLLMMVAACACVAIVLSLVVMLNSHP